VAPAGEPTIMPLFSASALSHAEILNVAAPVDSAQWTGEIASKLTQVIMTRQDHVELRLNPPQLGPVDVQVRMSADQATVLISAPHAITRDALEQALPQLRDALAQQGITLGQATVHSGPHRDPSNPGTLRAPVQDSRIPLALPDAPLRQMRPDRLVDTFA